MKLLFPPERYRSYFQSNIGGLWLPPQALESQWQRWLSEPSLRSETFGHSQQGRPLRALYWGRGPKRILLWSQMHGNEATATASLADWLALLTQPQPGEAATVAAWAEAFQICVVPMLNPDGAALFTRRNALGLDLNRDAVAQHSVEMQAFWPLLQNFAPHWCFNLHDQRSLFAVREQPMRSAALSFLAPSGDAQRSVTTCRAQTMRLIAAMAEALASLRPGHLGRYSDEFYPKALGDNLMQRDIPCILLEAGAFAGDPNRLVARELIFWALSQALHCLRSEAFAAQDIENYQAIPLNHMRQRDWIFRAVQLLPEGPVVHLALQAENRLDESGRSLETRWWVNDLGDLSHLGALDERSALFQVQGELKLDKPAHFTLYNSDQKWIYRHGILQEH